MKKKVIPFILSLTMLTTSVTSVFASDTQVNVNTSLETLAENEINTSEELSLELETKENLSLKKSSKSVAQERIKADLPEERIEFNPNARISGAHSPNTAFYIPQGLLNQNLSDTIGSQQNWYYFDTSEKSKISITLQMPQNSEYDLVLYKFNDGYLELVSLSQYYGTYEHLSYVAEAGTYFLGIMPYVPADNQEFLFRIDTTTKYDENEPDDNIWFAKEYTNTINQSQTIDNILDEDFFKLNVTTNENTYIGLSDITTEKYGVNIYDTNLNVIGNFIGDNKYRVANLPKGSYYIQVSSFDGKFNPNKNYKLNVGTIGSNEYIKTSIKGDIIKYSTAGISINNMSVSPYWNYEFRSLGYPYYTRKIEITPLKNSTVAPKFFPYELQVGTFSGKADSSSNAILVPITNIYAFRYFYQSGIGMTPYAEHLDITENKGYVDIVIDANTGKIIDSSLNTAYTDYDDFRRCFRGV